MTTERVAEGASISAVLGGWAGWFISHLAQINGVLQFLLLVASLVATVFAARYHWRKTPKGSL